MDERENTYEKFRRRLFYEYKEWRERDKKRSTRHVYSRVSHTALARSLEENSFCVFFETGIFTESIRLPKFDCQRDDARKILCQGFLLNRRKEIKGEGEGPK